MPVSEQNYIAERSISLAKVSLTRRRDITVTTLAEQGARLDLLAQLEYRDEVGEINYASFGVVVWGTSYELPDENVAAKHVNSRWRALRPKPRYSMPVLYLLFSMQDDAAFYWWSLKPSVSGGLPQMIRYSKDVEPDYFNKRTLDLIAETVKSWAEKMTVTNAP